jgi:transposase
MPKKIFLQLTPKERTMLENIVLKGDNWRVRERAREQPGSARDLQNRLESEGGTHVHLNTIRATLRRAGMVFKRTRHSLKKNEIRRHSSRRSRSLKS